jgi:hypothetical protein
MHLMDFLGAPCYHTILQCKIFTIWKVSTLLEILVWISYTSDQTLKAPWLIFNTTVESDDCIYSGSGH